MRFSRVLLGFLHLVKRELWRGFLVLFDLSILGLLRDYLFSFFKGSGRQLLYCLRHSSGSTVKKDVGEIHPYYV